MIEICAGCCIQATRAPHRHYQIIFKFSIRVSTGCSAEKVLIVVDFNIHVDNEKDALGVPLKDILNSFGVRQHVSGPSHCRNHTLDLILLHMESVLMHITMTSQIIF